MTTTEQELLAFINSNQIVLSLLYDLDLLPEQLERGSRDWGRMLSAAVHVQSIIAQDREKAIKAVESARMPPRSEALKAYNVGIEEAVKKLKEMKP